MNCCGGKDPVVFGGERGHFCRRCMSDAIPETYTGAACRGTRVPARSRSPPSTVGAFRAPTAVTWACVPSSAVEQYRRMPVGRSYVGCRRPCLRVLRGASIRGSSRRVHDLFFGRDSLHPSRRRFDSGGHTYALLLTPCLELSVPRLRVFGL